MKQFVFALVVSIFAVNAANACIARVSERKLFVVNLPGTEVVRAEGGDMIRMTLSHPVIPGKVRVDFDRSVLRPVTSVSVDQEGRVGAAVSQYFFEVIGAGDTTIRMGFVRSNGQTIGKVEQEVQTRIRPVTRGAKCM